MNEYNLWKQESDGFYKMTSEGMCSYNNNTIHSVGYIDFTGSNSRTVKTTGENNYQIIYILEGYGNYTIDTVKFSASQGDIVIIPPNLPHKYNYNNSDNTKVFFIHFSGEEFYKIIHSFNLNVHYTIGIQNKICERFNDILITLQKKQPLFKEIALNLSLVLISEIISTIHNNISPAKLAPAITRINKFPSENLALEDYAKMCILSVSCFSREFKKHTGFSPISYRNIIRINKAKELLISDNLPLNSISSALGFSSYSQFFEKFKKHTGYTPKKYREIHSVII